MELLQTGGLLVLALLPVLSFLLVLVLLDSYKLVRATRVLALLTLGGVAAALGLLVNRVIADATSFGPETIMRYWAPLVEELLKGAAVVVLILRRRVGFLVDAAIAGFAVGAGFAAVENIHYFVLLEDQRVVLWVIRGFGTAVMHGSVTAIMAIISRQLVDRWGGLGSGAFVPGWLLAISLHSLFNHFLVSPGVTTVLILVVLPLFFVLVFQISEDRTRQWLGVGFDSDAEMLEMLNAGQVTESRLGHYLRDLGERVSGTTKVDMVCLLRLRLELSIRAKGILLMRQAGFAPSRDPETGERFAELAYLERSIGTTGMLALKPVFHMSDRDLWAHHALRADETSDTLVARLHKSLSPTE
jgi:RsiW-degrading membrane proteinase PrsW (M82 family)